MDFLEIDAVFEFVRAEVLDFWGNGVKEVFVCGGLVGVADVLWGEREEDFFA